MPGHRLLTRMLAYHPRGTAFAAGRRMFIRKRPSPSVRGSDFFLYYAFSGCRSYYSSPARARSSSNDEVAYSNRYCHVDRRQDHYDELKRMLPHVEFTSNVYERERHGRGESYHPTKMPDLVAMNPSTVDDVRTIIRHCVRHRVPVVPFGAGTSVEGHVNALHGGICLDMAAFSSIEVPDVAGESIPDPVAVVGAGVTRKTLNEALRHTGFQFVVDPGADATLGGMVATCASGTSTIKHGTTRENILELECVLADEDATIVKCGTRALKNSAGYDLLSLFCGSEGTLGVITSITVKLHPIPDHVLAATCQFDSLHDAAAAVAALKLTEVPLSRCELLDTTSVEAFNAFNKQDNGKNSIVPKPTLFLEFQGHSEASLQEVVSTTEAVCVDDYGGSGFAFASDEKERQSLWSARHSLYYASVAYRPGSSGAIVADACVPLSKFADLIDETSKDVRKHDVVGPCFGHAGDGNLHVILPLKEGDSDEYLERVHAVYDNLIDRTLSFGGTCTGEHGIGYGKIPYLERQYGSGAVGVMKAIKQSLDPFNIMNPGKVVEV